MAIYRILRNSTFGPREISQMTTAYEVALIELGIDPTDPRTEIIASAIVHRASAGGSDIRALADFAIRQVNATGNAHKEPATADFAQVYASENPD
jgi:hypothetical protein